MTKRWSALLVFLILLMAPAIYRYLRYNATDYIPPQINEIPAQDINPSLPEYNSFIDEPSIGTGHVLIDLSHNNNLEINDLSVLHDRLQARGVTVELFKGEDQTLQRALKGASALVVVAPTTFYETDDLNLIKAFIADGGRLLLAADPTRPVPLEGEQEQELIDLFAIFFPTSAVPPINSLAAEFDIIYFDDYLYNLGDNAGNYRNVKFSNLNKEHSLTQGLESIVFFASYSLQSEGVNLITGDDNTLSPLRRGEKDLSAATLSSNEQVLALGDMTFLTAPYHTVAQNDQFLSRIADWLAVDSRKYNIRDFPYLFTKSIDLIQVNDGMLNSSLLTRQGELQSIFEAADLTINLQDQATPEHDLLYVGTYEDVELVQEYLISAGVTISITEGAQEKEAEEPGKSETIEEQPEQTEAPIAPEVGDPPPAPDVGDAPAPPPVEEAPPAPSEEEAPPAPSEEEAPPAPSEEEAPPVPSEEEAPPVPVPSEEEAPPLPAPPLPPPPPPLPPTEEPSGSTLIINQVTTETDSITLTDTLILTDTLTLMDTEAISDTMSEEETTEKLAGSIDIKGIGEINLAGSTLFVVDQSDPNRVVLIILAEDIESSLDGLNQLDAADFSNCVVAEAVTLCSTGTEESDSASSSDLKDNSESEPLESSAQGVGSIFILSNDDGSEGSRTSAPEFESILSTTYDVTVWSVSSDGLPTTDDIAGFDIYIIESGDYANEPDDFETVALFAEAEGGVIFMGEQGFQLSLDEPAALNDLEVIDDSHPLALGFTQGEIIALSQSESGVPAFVYPEIIENASIVLARGPDSGAPGTPILVGFEGETAGQRGLVGGFSFYRLPEDIQITLAFNIVEWLTE